MLALSERKPTYRLLLRRTGPPESRAEAERHPGPDFLLSGSRRRADVILRLVELERQQR